MKKVSIIITTYLPESKRYLDLCIRSIENLDYPKEDLEVIVVGKPSYLPQYKIAKTVCPPREHFHNSVGCNYGIKQASRNSDFIFLLNDDVFLTKNCLQPMISFSERMKCVLNGISPCDNNVQYMLTFAFNKDGYQNVITQQSHTYEQLEPYFNEMLDAESLYNMGFIKQEFLCMYATLFPRKIFDEIGYFDENLKTGQDDIDFSWRAIEKGYICGASLSSLIWHFGGATAAKTLDPSIRIANLKYFKDKWKKLPPGMDEALARLEKEQKTSAFKDRECMKGY